MSIVAVSKLLLPTNHSRSYPLCALLHFLSLQSRFKLFLFLQRKITILETF